MAFAGETVLALLRKHGSMRTPDLAAELGIGEAAIDAMLELERAAGRLITCTVQIGDRQVIEYRCSAAGTKVNPWRGLKPAPLSHVAAAQPNGATDQPPPPRGTERREAAQAATPSNPKGEANVTLHDEIKAELKTRGPATAMQLRKWIKTKADVPASCRQLAADGELRILGGKTSGVVYGLEGQTLGDRKGTDMLERGAELGRKPVARAKKRAGGGSVAMRRKKRAAALPVRRAPVPAAKKKNGFRPALTADGSILCFGAECGELELDKPTTRVLLDVARKLNPAELGAVVSFLELLDAGVVAA